MVHFHVFFRMWDMREPKIMTMEERVASMINAGEFQNGPRPLDMDPPEWLLVYEELRVRKPPKQIMLNPALELPMAVIVAMRELDDGEHAMALRALRHRINEVSVAQGISHSL